MQNVSECLSSLYAWFELCCVTEEFVTPLSTPPSEAEDATFATDAAKPAESMTSPLSESAIHSKIYETYDSFVFSLTVFWLFSIFAHVLNC